MFSFGEWLISGLISGFRSGEFTYARITELTAAYLSKGFITAAQAEAIIVETMPVEQEGVE